MTTCPLGATLDVCTYCGKRVFRIISESGQSVPLDPIPYVYQLEILNDAADPTKVQWVRANRDGNQEPAYVSHNFTCPTSNRRMA